MLQIQHICKEYRTGNLVQKALDDVSLNLRDNEFVAILGPSGSGKTTLLNIIGGLDRYDSGDLIINGISTKKYKDRDWDSYRNHTIGFVFQSYNLIPHQTVLSNVELALTISGIGKEERRKRAIDALKKVGLGEQLHKRPSQMSGGQMQRVAIARALVNDPDILLADEPTGALDSDTSIQVMDLLKEVAKDRLVVMVTHNPELAEEYATRIVNLRDGKIRSDTDEYIVDEQTLKEPEHKNMGKSSMSFLTALALSFNNLKTKKARTLLTSFAGSIGIIGIALILALSNGVNGYIQSIEEETLSEYPLQIQSTGFDITSMMVGNTGTDDKSKDSSGKKNKDGQVKVMEMVTNMFSKMNTNDLKSLKKHLEKDNDALKSYTNAVEYDYDVDPQIYREGSDGVRQVHPDKSFSSIGIGADSGANSMMSSMMSTNVFYRMPKNTSLYEKQYDVKAGRWPKKYNECVLVLSQDGGMSDFLLYTLGLRDQMELDDMIKAFASEEEIKTPSSLGTYTYKDILNKKFKLVNQADYYEYDSQYKVWKDKSDNAEYMKKLVADGEDIKIVGIVQPAEGSKATALNMGIGYPYSLMTHVAEEAKNSEIVKQQKASPDINVFTGEKFGEDSGDNGLDMNSLFSVDEDALQKAFGMGDTDLAGSLGNSLDFSKAVNLQDAFKLDVKVKPGGMQKMAVSLMEGYQAYAKTHPEADYSHLGDNFSEYLKTDGAKQIMKKYFSKILKESGKVTITEEKVQKLLTDIMQGFEKYVKDQGIGDISADQYGTYFRQYLQTAEAKQIITDWVNDLYKDVDIEISEADLQAMAQELAAGYLSYAQEKGYADVTKMGENFAAYLGTADGKQRLSNGLSETLDMKSLESQLSSGMNAYMKQAMGAYAKSFGNALETQIGQNLQSVMTDAMKIDTDAFAKAFQFNMTEDDLTELMMSMSGTASATYDSNLQKLGYADFEKPSEIDIYPKDFESKEQVVDYLDRYNKKMEKAGKDEQVISYTDVVGTLISSVTDIVNTISYVLIAFVAISLVVSSIMIGVITYISVLERKKEIGILRAIGASKRNVSQVFNAETFIIGLCAGLIGIGLTLLLLLPGNMIIHAVADNSNVNAVLPVIPALVLIALSVVLTLLGGLIPSKKASNSDPVTALRTE
ncbi:ATP-binding cassette domain-containing protein [Dorea longicatena]|uniref:ATP-binding cassette domain-containing protein n=1 Tax=Dorea longicatena TaxID=88431 RepID=A0A6N9JUS2_9FIRM|nr:ATP-binding cassette domain-containing protein [Dorea longicatena]MZK06236.1 ATP-binding cassette domain-containing protein [Dorea longicatena]MZK09652.1 ATP-binding cassette domain-containing protein [Dorea longicatena]MZK46669.1 ATP-binding cassette domain-containing protein [Dorea longicatena]